MKIKLNEVIEMSNYMDERKFDEFVCNIQETQDFNEILDEITEDLKHLASQYLYEAIKCNFSHEVLSIDCGISNDIIDIIQGVKDYEVDTNVY
ncbi:MAG: hypothetical protein J6T10_22540 [Methanobrevibacter sp.]|nr:hypothetical protein [Methanobrevibacter sp.]